MLKPLLNETNDNDYNYCIQTIKHIITKFKARESGSRNEYQAQKFLAEEFKKLGTSNSIQTFNVHPWGFVGGDILSGIFVPLAVIFYWFNSSLAVLFAALAFIVFVCVIILYKDFFDFLFPKKKSHNLIATLPSSGKQKLYISAHVDAAHIWRYNRKIGAHTNLLLPIILFVFPYSFLVLLITAANFLSPLPQDIYVFLGLFITTFAFPYSYILLTFYKSTISPGANDNLSGVMALLLTAKTIHEQKITLKNTELAFLVTGSEESGLRGAKAFAKEVLATNNAANTLIINVDTLRDMGYFAVYNKDRFGLVEHNKELAEIMVKAGNQVGVPLPFHKITVGATDSAAFSERGIRSIDLSAMNPMPATYYHSEKDNWDNISPECIMLGSKILVNAIKIIDQTYVKSGKQNLKNSD